MNIYEWDYCILFFLLLFQSVLSNISDFFSYSDELFALWGLFKILQHVNRINIWRKYESVHKIYYFISLIVIIGWISTYTYRIQMSLGSNVNDCFTLLKFFFILFLSLYFLERSRLQVILRTIGNFISVYIIAGFICLLISQVVDIGMSTEVRFGMNDFKFVNSNSGDYSSILIISLAVIHVLSYYSRKSFGLLKFMTVILIIFTFRGKALGFIATYIMIVFIINRYNYISNKSLLFLSIAGIIAGFFQIKYYFIDNVTPRSLFIANGIITANEFFPLGSGYSTYGSNMAKVHYSPLYESYGFNEIWGMNEEEQQFLNDNFWPMIMGQYGWIGMILYILIIVCLFKIINNSIVNKQLKIAGFSIIFLLIYSSIGGPIFVHYIGCATIIIFSLILKANKSLPNVHSSYLKKYNIVAK